MIGVSEDNVNISGLEQVSGIFKIDITEIGRLYDEITGFQKASLSSILVGVFFKTRPCAWNLRKTMINRTGSLAAAVGNY